MNGHLSHQREVYVVGFKLSGVEMVHRTVNRLLGSQYANSPPTCRNGATAPTATCCVNVLPTEHFIQTVSSNDAKVIYVVRNPKDVAVAMHKNTGLETTIPFSDFLNRFVTEETVGGKWFDHTSQWTKVQSINSSQLHIIYFKSLIQDLEGEVGKLCDFLNIDLSAEKAAILCSQMCLESEQPAQKRQRIKHTISSHEETFYQVGLWKNYFTVGLNEEFNTTFSHLLSNISLLDAQHLLS